MNDNAVKVYCGKCGKSRDAKPTRGGNPRVPMGWKRAMDWVWCDACWHANWKLRAITIPIAGPADATWAELREALRTCWQSSTRLANWTMTQLYTRDVRREPGVEKMPAMPKIYLYPEARIECPEMDSQSVSSLLQAVERKYRAKRYDVIWRAAESLPNHRYPVPYPIHNAAWSVSRDDGGGRYLSVRLAGRRWSLRLRGGPRHRRMMGAVDQLIRGEAVRGELAIYQTSASSSVHRPSSAPATQLMAKMVMWLPKKECNGMATSTLHVRTGGDSLLIYHVDDGEPRYLHADQVRKWIAAHADRLQRISDDTKMEKRRPKRMMRGISERRQAMCRKHHRRLDSFVHEATAMLVGFARRQQCGKVVLDVTNQSFANSFPYHDLKGKLAYKLDEHGITLETSGGVVAEKPDSLEVETSQ